jgi:hypothetical protein
VRRLAKGMVTLPTRYTAVNDVPCGRRFTITNSIRLKRFVVINSVALIVYRTLSSSPSSIVIHDPGASFIHIVQGPSRVQKFTHFHFSAVFSTA